jgi:sec-independent protein translocase protein TatC
VSDDKPKEELAEGTLMSHLLELRDRLLRAMLTLLVVFVPCAVFANEIYTLVAQPLLEKLPQGTTLIATNVVSPFMTPFKLAFYASIFLSMPMLLSSVILFYAGVLFAYFVVFPVMFTYLVTTAPTGVTYMPDIAAYLDFVLTLFFAFGVAFEVPVAVVLLVLTGLVKVESLGKNRGYVVIGIFVVAAVLTPPDAISQVIMAIPMWLLYEGGLVMARIMQKMRREAAEQAEKEEAEAG